MPADSLNPARPVLPAPLVGRAVEWATAMACCQRTLAGGGGLLLLRGEAGIGKTALMRSLTAWAGTQGVQVVGGAYPDLRNAPPYHGLRQALAQLLGVRSTDPASAIEGRVSQALHPWWPELRLHRRAITRFLRPTGLGSAALDRDAALAHAPDPFHDLLFRLVAARARSAPLLLLLDDCHWADVPSLEAIAYLGSLLAAEPALLVVAYRPDEPTSAASFLADLAGRRDTEAISLSRLSAADVGTLLGNLPDQAPLALAADLHRVTEGVPLYIEQFLELQVETGTPLSPAVLDAPLPRRLVDLFERRVGLLDDSVRGVLWAAAVVGDPFSAELAAAALEQPTVAVLPALAALETRGLIHSQADPAPSGERFAFHHPLLQRVLYERMPGAQRLLMHGRLADVLAARSADQAEFLFAAAHHYRAAGAADKGGGVFLAAGQRALALGAAEEARTYLQRALASYAAPTQRGPRAACAMALGQACRQLGEHHAAVQWWEAALRDEDGPERRVQVYLCLAESPLADTGASGMRWEYLSAALRETAASPESGQRCQVLTRMVGVQSPDLALNRQYACQAVRWLRRRPDPQLWFDLLVALSQTRGASYARPARRRRLLRRAARLAEQQELWRGVVSAQLALNSMVAPADLEGMPARCEATYRLAKACLPPDAVEVRSALDHLVNLHVHLGNTAEAKHYAALIRQLGGEPSNPPGSDPEDLEARWQAARASLRDMASSELAVSVDHILHLSRYLRLAGQLDRRAAAADYLAALKAAYPATLWPLEPVRCDAPWALPATSASAPAAPGLSPPGPGSAVEPSGLRALTWRRASTDDRCTWYGPDEVELVAGFEVGLGAAGTAPGLFADLEGDFVLQVCVRVDPHLPAGGGVVVFDGRRLLRLASCVDHLGQLSLCRAGDIDRRSHVVGNLGEGTTWLRLRRQGRVYAALASTDQCQWYTCGEVGFGSLGPVRVGLFAEPGRDAVLPFPGPVRFSGFQLWQVGGGAADATPQGTTPSVAPRGRVAAESTRKPARTGVYALPPVPAGYHGMVGQGPAFTAFTTDLARVAAMGAPVLIAGETGVGKELAARAIHSLSPRHAGPFVPLNVAALAPELVESELFGHRRGAFTGAHQDHPGLFVAANTGTLFMDEIGELPLAHQAKLLRVLDDGEVRPVGAARCLRVEVRCVAATNRDLREAVAAGRFRADLLYRVGQQLTVPPLRDRREDLPLLVAYFLARLDLAMPPPITVEAMAALTAYDWPGNVRQLRAVLHRATALAVGEPIAVSHLSLDSWAPAAANTPAAARQMPSAAELTGMLQACNGDMSALSRRCGVSRNTVYRWFRRLGLDPDAGRRGV